MERNEENVKMYASFMCTLCTKEKIKHLDASGIAAIIEYSSRLAEDQDKLSTWFAQVADIIKEAPTTPTRTARSTPPASTSRRR